ncbi:serine hydrolase [Microbulbifer agarilyticus]|uniref:serine hydrolase domain-containing protein n=1 Tax=Microbulbifer agarilyticus TaxID=260552 RepID=UPI001C950C0E|nr:serine hydrolase domain-containing protein [Microbulbifer agarilyticus]MBY6189243.1 serine hydrolase [Microbulbifer agarilyticus]
MKPTVLALSLLSIAPLAAADSPYFDQELPGAKAKLFAKDTVSVTGRYEYGIAFSKDLDEMYFSGQQDGKPAAIYSSKLVDGAWQPIKQEAFTKGQKAGEMQPFFSPDGKQLFFTAYNADFTDTKFWTVGRVADGWGAAKKLASPINDSEVFYSTLAGNGDLFFTNIIDSSVYHAPLVDGEYPKVDKAGIELGIHGFISPQQDYLLVDAKAAGGERKDSDIYVYFKQPDGGWSKPVSLGSEVNSTHSETVPSVTPDGKYLFFSRYDEEGGISNFYWISSEVIDEVRPAPRLTGPYLGQKPPGKTPEVFAPGIVSTQLRDYSGFFSPDMSEFYFTRKARDENKWSLISYKNQNGNWQKQSTEPRVGRPIFSPDGNTMHLGKQFKTRTADGWSEIKSLGAPYEDIRIMRLMSSAKGTYVLDEATRDGSGPIRYSRVVDGKRQAPQPFGPEINAGKWNAHPFIAPDESYMIWDGERTSGYGDNDLYVSFRQPDGSWGEGINMGDKINTEVAEGGAIVTPDGKYLFFNRTGDDGNGDIYWVDTKVVEELRYRDANNLSATATPLEAKIRHWNMPDIKRNFWHIPLLAKPWLDTKPTDKNDGIAVGELGVDAGHSEAILALTEEVADKQHDKLDSLLIAHKGKLLFESYYARGRIDLPHPQSSVTKAYTTLALGRAMELGYLTLADLDKPIVSFLKGLDRSKLGEGADKITLQSALDMNSGLQISDEDDGKYDANPEKYSGVGLVQAFLEDTAPITDDSRRFEYLGANPIMVMQVIESLVPGSAESFVRTEVFGKLGITNYSWRNDASGLARGETGSSLTSRDMLKLGILVMNDGQFNGEQLLSQEFVQRLKQHNLSLTDQQSQDFYSGANLSNPGYTNYWWPFDMTVGDKTYSVTSAQGAGGVAILVIDQLELVIVVTGHTRESFLQMAAEKILPAFGG